MIVLFLSIACTLLPRALQSMEAGMGTGILECCAPQKITKKKVNHLVPLVHHRTQYTVPTGLCAAATQAIPVVPPTVILQDVQGNTYCLTKEAAACSAYLQKALMYDPVHAIVLYILEPQTIIRLINNLELLATNKSHRCFTYSTEELIEDIHAADYVEASPLISILEEALQKKIREKNHNAADVIKRLMRMHIPKVHHAIQSIYFKYLTRFAPWQSTKTSIAAYTETLSPLYSPTHTMRILMHPHSSNAYLIDTRKNSRIGTLEHKAALIAAHFSLDENRIITTSYDKTIRIWDTTAQLLQTLSGHTRPVVDAHFSPDNTLIVTASWDGTARIWEVATGKNTMTLDHGKKSVYSAHFSPQGTYIITTTSSTETAHIWDAFTGKHLNELTAKDPFKNALFSEDESIITTTSFGHTINVWEQPLVQQFVEALNKSPEQDQQTCCIQ